MAKLKDESKEGKGKGKGKKQIPSDKPSLSDVKEANKAVLDFPADAIPGGGIEVAQTENTEAFPIDRVGEDTPPVAAGEDTPVTFESAEPGPVLTVTEETPVTETPVTEETPETPVTEETPETPETPVTEETPETPVTEETPKTPVTETPEVPDPIDENPLNAGVFGSPIIISETVTETPAPVVETPVVEAATPVFEETVTDPTAAIEPVKPTQEELEEKVIERWYNEQNQPSEVNHFELANSSAGVNMTKFSSYEAIVGKFKFKRSSAADNWKITVDETK